MPRLHLVELEDLPWFPATLRDGGTAFLALAERMSGHGRQMLGPLERLLRATGATQLVDLCSGSGGPSPLVLDALRARGHAVDLVLTDLYPAGPALQAAADGRPGLRAHPDPVDARAVPPALRGVRTIWNAFHHLRPEDARAVLQDAVDQGQPIAIFEVVSRELPMLLGLLLTPLTVTLTAPLWRPFRWSWLLWTWVIPVMQPFVLWDGLVSWLRVYSEDELRELIRGVHAPGWAWEVGRQRLGGAPLHGTYLIGHPAPPAG